MASSSVAVTSEDSANSSLAIHMAPAESLPGEVREPLSGGASTPSGVRASPETARPSPAPVPTTARTGATIRNNRIHRPNVVTRRAAAELTGAVTRYTQQKQQRRRRQHQQQQPRGSGGTFPAEYAAQTATTRYLHHHGHAR